MYCSSCGASVSQGLTYCNRCGAKLAGASAESATLSESLIWATVAVFVIGLGATIGLMAVMKNELGFNEGLILLFSLLSFLLMFTIEGVLIYLLLRNRRGLTLLRETARIEEKQPKELATARALAEPAPTVTEHTTRSFDHAYEERDRK